MALSSADEERMRHNMLHAIQVQEGLIPEDSPPAFVRPEGDDALVDGLPWWFGPDYSPTSEAIAEFSKPVGLNRPDAQSELFNDCRSPSPG